MRFDLEGYSSSRHPTMVLCLRHCLAADRPPIAPPSTSGTSIAEISFVYSPMPDSRGSAVRSHWKQLRIGYAYEQLGVFGPELQRLARPVQRMPRVLDWQLPMYGGEMLLLAVRSSQ